MRSSRNVSFVPNPLIIHIVGDPEGEQSILYAVVDDHALVQSEGDLGWVHLDRVTVKTDMVTILQTREVMEEIERESQPSKDPGPAEVG